MPEYITENREIYSDDSNLENRDEENSNEEKFKEKK